MSQRTTTDRDQILSKITSIVQQRHFNVGGVNYEEWVSNVESSRASLRTASAREFEAGVNGLLKLLKTSHAAFYHEIPGSFPSQHTIGATLKLASVDGTPQWMFLDIFPESVADQATIRPGELLIQIDGRDPEDNHEPPRFKIAHTHTLTLHAPHDGTTRKVEVSVPNVKATKERPPMVEPKSVSTSMLPDGIGVLRVTYFPGSLGLRFNREIDAAVTSLTAAGARGLVLDLRGNIGGSLGFARLASHLCRGKVAVGHSLTPARLRSGYTTDTLPHVPMPSTRVEAALTLARFALRDKSLFLMTQSLGPKPFHGRLVVLVNEWTNSAGEIVAAFAHEQGLGTLVGRKTRGNVLGASNFSVGGGYWLRIPVFGWYTARGKLLEKVGVAPDFDCDHAPEQLSSGCDEQLALARGLIVQQQH